MDERHLDPLFRILREGLETNANLNEKRKFVNSILPVHKYTLLKRFLSFEDETLQRDEMLNCFHIFLDENTKFISFRRETGDQEFIQSILEIIPRYCPNIQTVDFRNLWIQPRSKSNFQTFLKQTTSLKSLRLQCRKYDCAIYELLITDNFNILDRDVKYGLLKIDYLHGFRLNVTDCAKLLNRILNLKSFAHETRLTPLLYYYREDDQIAKKLPNITELYESQTHMIVLECFVKFCPKVEKIALYSPQKKVVANLWRFKLLTELILYSRVTVLSELISLLQVNGQQIKLLILTIPEETQLVGKICRELCPEIVTLIINHETFDIQ